MEYDEDGHEGLVFPGDGRDGYLVNGTILKRELYPAMKRAGITRRRLYSRLDSLASQQEGDSEG